MKTCCRCGLVKDLSCFDSHIGKDGRFYIKDNCINCHKEVEREAKKRWKARPAGKESIKRRARRKAIKMAILKEPELIEKKQERDEKILSLVDSAKTSVSREIKKINFENNTALCSGCKKWLPVINFCANKRSPTGIQSRCLTCEADRRNLRKMFDVAIRDVPEEFYKLNCKRLALVRETKIAKKELL